MAATTTSTAPTRVPGLSYATDESPGIARAGRPGAFVYRWPGGRLVKDGATLRRIRSLAVPPAWTDVWISPNAVGHIQATGRDARRRKQYRYHPRWRTVRDEAKFDHLLEFARALPVIRRALTRDLAKAPFSRKRVLAVVVSLLERTHIRVGNDEYARTNDSYGLTTLKDGHARIQGKRVEFRFKGKSGVMHHISVEDPVLARDVRRCQDLPGQTLFQYLDEKGQPRTIGSTDVNWYLADVSGTDVTAKDFRTWWGTVSVARLLRESPAPRNKTEAKQLTLRAIDSVAGELGNTRAVCRACYVHPAVLAAFSVGNVAARAQAKRRSVKGLTDDEAWTVAFLQGWAEQPPRARRGRSRQRAVPA
ncbi:MAG: DNA topoisomerase IB [Acidobacteriota bacterium]